MKTIGQFIKTVLILAIIVIGGAIAYAYSGHYDVSVGSGHMPWTSWYLQTLRHRSIETRAADIEVPDLSGREMFEAGAIAYDQTCAGCHGRPGREPSDSFEPSPPALTRHEHDPAQLFWVVRNGIKMSAMPRIGENRVSDEQVWQIAAFVQDASRLTEGEYRELVEQPEPEAEPEAVEEEAEAGDSEAGDAGEPEASAEATIEDPQAADAAVEEEDGSDGNGEANDGDTGGSGGEGI